MAKSTFRHAKITGLSVVVPDIEKSIDDEAEFFDGSLKMLERAKKVLGYGTRRRVPEGTTAADLCEAAARKLIDDMGIDVDTIDALVMVSQQPDHSMPGSGCVVHGKLGLPTHCAAFDINHGCAGYAYGLWLASSMIESGACKRILLLAGDINVQEIDNRVKAMFGDAGSATLIEYSEKEVPSYFSACADGKSYDAIVIPAGNTTRLQITKEIMDITVTDTSGIDWKLYNCFLNGMEVFNFSIKVIPPHLTDLMDYAGITADDVDFCVLHQANKQIVSSVAMQAKIPKDKYSSETFSKYGNQSIASLPGQITHLLSEQVSTGRRRLLLSGFGVGLAWCSAIVYFDNIYCSGVVTRKFEPLSQRELVGYWIDKISKS